MLASPHAAAPIDPAPLRRGALGTAGTRVPPGPKGPPLLGVGVQFQYDPLRRLTAWLREYGDVVHYRVAGTPWYLLGHPDDIASVLVGEHARYMKDELTHELARFVGRGLLTSEGSFWRRQRRIAAPSFQPRHLVGFAATMTDRSQRMLATWPDASARDVHEDMMRLTLDIVLQTLFGAATIPDLDAVGDIVSLLMADFQQNFLTWRRLLPAWFNREAIARIDGARDRLDAILYDIIRQRRAAADPEHDGDLLGRLLAARDDDGSRMTDLQLRDEVATLFLAGHETTALALSYALHLLAHHPDVQERLHAELEAVLDGGAAGLEHVARLPFTDAVVRETLRLYPPAWVVGREALEDCTIAGWRIPRGAQVLMPLWSVHRDPRWFEDPERFTPERWLGGLAERLPRFAYFPFGGGPRVCVGNHFAMLEAVLVLATVAQRYRVSPVGPLELRLLPSVTLRPKDGVVLRTERRST